MKLPIQSCVFERRGNLPCHRAEQTHVLAVQRLAGVFAADGQHGDGAFLREARDEVIQARVAPVFDLLHRKPC